MNERTERMLKATWLATRITGSISSRLAAPFVSKLWFTPWPVPVPERARAKQARWLEKTRPVTFRVNGHGIPGFVAGEGPTVLLLHGWGEDSAAMGALVDPLVRAGYKVIGIDHPGSGKSGLERTDIFQLSALLRALARRVGGFDTVVAHSMGGYVTMVALSEGLELNQVVLIAPASDVNHVMTKFEKLFALPHRALEGLRLDVERRWGREVWDRLDVRRHARDFRARALIVHDRDDAQIDVSESEALAAAWAGARTLITSGLGHDKPMRDPSVISAVTQFLVAARHPVEEELALSR